MTTEPKPRYFSFWWPLALTGLCVLLARQIQNGALARFPEAVRELAVFALAASTFDLFSSAVGFVSQMTNVLARDRRDARTLLLFLALASAVLTAPLGFLAFTGAGQALLSAVYGIEGGTLDAVARYLRLLSPLVVVNALRHYNVGRLIQAGRTGTVTLLNAAHLGSVVLLLVAGVSGGWGALTTLAVSQVASAALHLSISAAARWRLAPLPAPSGGAPLTFRAAFAYFWPVAVTSVMFALSRPAIYLFAARTRDSERLLAALRVAFDFSLIFHDPLNQFRHLFATFGERDLPGLRRFMLRITAVLSAAMAAIAFTPPGAWIFEGAMGLEPGLVPMVRAVMAGVCLIPAAVTLRNWYHGLALVRRRTGSMALGSALRVAATGAVSWALFAAGLLTPLGAGFALLAGFAVEALMVSLAAPGAPEAPAPDGP